MRWDSRRARPRRTTATAADRCRAGSPIARELEALLEPLHDLDKGVAALLPGERIKHADVHEIQQRLGRPLTWTALLTIKGFPWHEDIIKDNDAARAEGGQVWPQVSVRPLVFQMNLREPFTFNMAPAFAELMAEPDAVRLERYADPAWRERAISDLNNKAFLRPNWDALEVAESTAHPELIDRNVVVDSPNERGVHADRRDARHLARREPRDPLPLDVLANNDPEAIAWLLGREGVLLGLADSGAHVSQLCDACLPTDLLGNWVREKRGHLARAGGEQADRRAGRRVRPRPCGRRPRAAARGHGRGHHRLRPRHRRARAAPPDPRLPRRRRAPHRRRADGR